MMQTQLSEEAEPLPNDSGDQPTANHEGATSETNQVVHQGVLETSTSLLKDFLYSREELETIRDSMTEFPRPVELPPLLWKFEPEMVHDVEQKRFKERDRFDFKKKDLRERKLSWRPDSDRRFKKGQEVNEGDVSDIVLSPQRKMFPSSQSEPHRRGFGREDRQPKNFQARQGPVDKLHNPQKTYPTERELVNHSHLFPLSNDSTKLSRNPQSSKSTNESKKRTEKSSGAQEANEIKPQISAPSTSDFVDSLFAPGSDQLPEPYIWQGEEGSPLKSENQSSELKAPKETAESISSRGFSRWFGQKEAQSTTTSPSGVDEIPSNLPRQISLEALFATAAEYEKQQQQLPPVPKTSFSVHSAPRVSPRENKDSLDSANFITSLLTNPNLRAEKPFFPLQPSNEPYGAHPNFFPHPSYPPNATFPQPMYALNTETSSHLQRGNFPPQETRVDFQMMMQQAREHQNQHQLPTGPIQQHSQPTSNGPQQEGGLEKWFGNLFLGSSPSTLPPLPSNVKIVSLEEIEKGKVA